MHGNATTGSEVPTASHPQELAQASRNDAHEDVRDDPLRQNRGIATLTFAHTLTTGLIASATIVYASKPEFRGEVEKEWSSWLGLNYKFGLPGGR